MRQFEKKGLLAKEDIVPSVVDFEPVVIGAELAAAPPPDNGQHSLNAGLELDAAEMLETHASLAAPVPCLVDDSAEMPALVALETQYLDLLSLAQSIEKAGGMTRAFALEAERVMPGFLTVHENYFTQAPSATRLTMSMEQITASLAALITAAVLAVIALIAKVYKWWTGGEKGSDSEKVGEVIRAQKKATEVSKEVAATIKEVDRALSSKRPKISVPKVSSSSAAGAKADDAGGNEIVEVKSLDHAVTLLFPDGLPYLVSAKASPEPLLYDLLRGGRYSMAIVEVGGALRAIEAVLVQKLDILEEVAKTDLSSWTTTTMVRNKSLLSKAVAPVAVRFQGELRDLTQIDTILSKELAQARSEQPAGEIEIEMLAENIARAYDRIRPADLINEASACIKRIEELGEALEPLRVVSGSPDTDGKQKELSKEIGPMLRLVISAVGTDISKLSKILHEIRHCSRTLSYHGMQISGIVKEILKRLDKRMPEKDEHWSKSLKNVESHADAMRMGYVKVRKNFEIDTKSG